MGSQGKVNRLRRQQAHDALVAEQEREDRKRRDMVERASDLYEALRRRVDAQTREAMAARVNEDGAIAGIFELYDEYVRAGGTTDGSGTNVRVKDGQVVGVRSGRS